jgi:hypothetical protein
MADNTKMITVITTMRYSEPVDYDELVRRTKLAVPLYHDIPGLVRKYFCIAPDRQSMIGVYLWESREAFEKKFTPEWKAELAKRSGAAPEFAIFDVTAIADNAARNIAGMAATMDF